MRDVLLLLLYIHTVKVSPQPYRADSEGRCRDALREYKLPASNLCCKRCRPGQSLNQECSDATDSVCGDCGAGRYMETWNYYKNCFTCTKCKESKGLQYAEECSSVRNAKCVCQPGMFCTMGYDEPHCKECVKYRTCKVGYGVSIPGSAESDVRCKPCLDGTFSDTDSITDRCRPHTNCSGSLVIRRGDATSDTVCARQTTKTPSAAARATASTTSPVEANSASAAPRPSGATEYAGSLGSTEMLSPSSESPPPTTESAVQLVGAIAGVFGAIFLLIILMLLCFCKRVWRRDSARLQPKVDANRKGRSDDKISPMYLESQLTTFTVSSPEHQCLMEKEPTPCSGRSPSRNSAETSSGPDSHSSHESIDPSRLTLVSERPNSALSEPMTLLSDTEPTPPQPGVPAPPPSQPASPQIVSPVTPSPHVNVNITLNIGNGSCGGPSCLLTGLKPADCDLPFGEEEECVSTPQQEGGKESLMSAEESDGDCT